MSASSPHAIFNCVIGADQAGPAKGVGDSFLLFLGGNLSPAAAASALTVFDGAAAGNVILLTLTAPASGGTAPGNLPSLYTVQNAVGLHYTLSGAASTAQLYWQTS